MLSEIELSQPNFYGFENVVYSALTLLNDRKDYDLDVIINWLDDELLIFQERQIDESIDLAKSIVKSNPETYSQFFNKVDDCDDLFIDPNLDYIFSHFKLLNYEIDWIEKYEILEQFLEQTDLKLLNIPSFSSSPEKYEIMAILALSYVNKALYYYDNKKQTDIFEKSNYLHRYHTLSDYLMTRKERGTREIISAFITIDKAKEFKNKIFINQLEENAEKKY